MRHCKFPFIKTIFVPVFTICSTLIFYNAGAQSVNKNWQIELDQQLSDYKKCKEGSSANQKNCRNISGKLLKTVYRLDDFYSSKQSRYMVANEVADFLNGNAKWKKLGYAYEQSTLDKAQELANAKRAVVAVFVNAENDGLVSVILPGEMVNSGSWGFKVPNSTSFFVHEPQKSYVGKGLSYAFNRSMIKNVTLFARNY